MPYSLSAIRSMLKRELGIKVSEAKLKAALEKPVWEPEMHRMIAVGNDSGTLGQSRVYGVYTGMTNGKYEIAGAGTSLWRHARPLTAAEIATCY